MANLECFEIRVSTALDETRALIANLRHIVNDLWSEGSGANYKAVYAILENQETNPVGGVVTKQQMNNAIAGIETILNTYDSVSTAINVVAEFSPNVLNLGA